MTVGAYTREALSILQPAMEARMAADNEAYTEGGLAASNIARNGTPERIDIARTALERNGYRESGTDETGATIYRRDYTRSSFAVLTLAHNGKAVAVNPRRVLHVESQSWDGSAWETFVVLTHGDPLRVRESVAEAVAKLEAVAA